MNFGIIFILLFVALIIAGICWVNTTYYKLDRPINAMWGFIVSASLLIVFTLIIPWASYYNYMELKEYKEGKYQQYSDTVKEYNRIISQHRGSQGEITDLKFQGFQQPMAKLIREHRMALTNYNTTLIGKRMLANNFLIGFLIVEPDPDMKVLSFIPII